MGSAIQRRNCSIQAPGRGRRRRIAGTKPTSRKGSASPAPSATNTSKPWSGSITSAAPSASAMNGPVHGVATKAASSPVEKEPPRDGAPPEIAKPGIVNRLRKLAVIASASRNSAATTSGSCNWNAQPICSPAARSSRMAPPSAEQASTTPAV